MDGAAMVVATIGSLVASARDKRNGADAAPAVEEPTGSEGH